MPTITIIVPVYKVEPYIHRCIDSILAQTYTDFELILVDDGSPDNCGAICNDYAAKDKRIHVIHQANGGLSAARNAGIDWAFANSDSQWLSFVDSDDWIHPMFLEVLLKAVINNKAEIACCSRKEVEVTDESMSVIYEDNLIDETISSQEALHRLAGDEWLTYNYTWNKLYKKDLFCNIRFPNGKNYEDVFVMHELFGLSLKICTISLLGYYYRIRPNSIMRQKLTTSALTDVEGFCVRFLYYYSHELVEDANMVFQMAMSKYSYYCKHLGFFIYKDITKLHQIKKALLQIVKLKKSSNLFKTMFRILLPNIFRILFLIKHAVNK